jgi:hypothetical protein
VETRAFLDWGRWVADCPGKGCTHAQELQLFQDSWVCRNADGSGCGTVAEIVWPSRQAVNEIIQEMQDRPEAERQWRPSDG